MASVTQITRKHSNGHLLPAQTRRGQDAVRSPPRLSANRVKCDGWPVSGRGCDRQVNEDHVVIEIVSRHGGNAVLMSAEDYDSLQETLYLFSTRANATHILRGLAEARDGRAEPADTDTLASRFNIDPGE